MLVSLGSFEKYEEQRGECRLSASVFVLFREVLGALLGERRFAEEVVGETRIVLASVIEDLDGAEPVVFPGNLQWRPDAVFQLIFRVDGDIFVDLLILLVFCDDHAANQEMGGTINGQAKFALLAVANLNPIHLLEVHDVVAAEADGDARLLEPQPQKIVDVALDLFLEFADGSGRQLVDAAAVESPAMIAVVQSDDDAAVCEIQTVDAN